MSPIKKEIPFEKENHFAETWGSTGKTKKMEDGENLVVELLC